MKTYDIWYLQPMKIDDIWHRQPMKIEDIWHLQLMKIDDIWYLQPMKIDDIWYLQLMKIDEIWNLQPMKIYCIQSANLSSVTIVICIRTPTFKYWLSMKLSVGWQGAPHVGLRDAVLLYWRGARLRHTTTTSFSNQSSHQRLRPKEGRVTFMNTYFKIKMKF